MDNFNPRDLSISIRCVTSPQHVLNGGPQGATFPGWFLRVNQNEGYDNVIPPVQLSVDQVEVIADLIDRTVDNTDRSKWRTINAVRSCNEAVRNDIRRQLEVAEKQAARIPALKKMLGEGS